MKILKKFAVGCAAALLFAALSVPVSAASTYSTPAEAAAGVTGMSLEDVITQRQDGVSYGTIAALAGKLDEFQTAMLEMRKDTLDGLVAEGTITQMQADTLLEAMESRQAVCDGTGAGAGCGFGAGQGRGRGAGRGYRCWN